MPNAPKNAGQKTPAEPGDLPFEEALKKLEAIVEAMESEDLPLESLITRYEEGMKLARVCQQKLAQAETRIQVLERDASGELKLQPLAVEPPEAT
ncbi:MAG TPA: exodeoxyribonuclease VII small subunit [Verrucomicrobiota bacterium]|nr:exodeoxyribonuclease VII small subunit [Verrucomicrobiota bacterium]HRT58464.1 exodeoxyribonuclease VII small subunit [Candidatus Paceibacterota bacterium]